MNCKKCGAKLKNGAKFCQACGEAVDKEETNETNTMNNNQNMYYQQYQQPQGQMQNQTPSEGGNGLAIASVVLGGLSLFLGWFLVLLPIIGLILGLCQKKKGALKVVGIVLNSIALVIVALIWFFAVTLIKSVNDAGPEKVMNGLFGIDINEWEEKLDDLDYNEEDDLIDDYFHTDDNKTTEDETPIEESVEPAGL